MLVLAAAGKSFSEMVKNKVDRYQFCKALSVVVWALVNTLTFVKERKILNDVRNADKQRIKRKRKQPTSEESYKMVILVFFTNYRDLGVV